MKYKIRLAEGSVPSGNNDCLNDSIHIIEIQGVAYVFKQHWDGCSTEMAYTKQMKFSTSINKRLWQFFWKFQGCSFKSLQFMTSNGQKFSIENEAFYTLDFLLQIANNKLKNHWKLSLNVSFAILLAFLIWTF